MNPLLLASLLTLIYMLWVNVKVQILMQKTQRMRHTTQFKLESLRIRTKSQPQ